eukprot:2795452-Amphidinium_carterae.1
MLFVLSCMRRSAKVKGYLSIPKIFGEVVPDSFGSVLGIAQVTLWAKDGSKGLCSDSSQVWVVVEDSIDVSCGNSRLSSPLSVVGQNTTPKFDEEESQHGLQIFGVVVAYVDDFLIGA